MPTNTPLGRGSDQVHRDAAESALRDAVREELRRALEPVLARIEALERAVADDRAVPRAPHPKNIDTD